MHVLKVTSLLHLENVLSEVIALTTITSDYTMKIKFLAIYSQTIYEIIEYGGENLRKYQQKEIMQSKMRLDNFYLLQTSKVPLE